MSDIQNSITAATGETGRGLANVRQNRSKEPAGWSVDCGLSESILVSPVLFSSPFPNFADTCSTSANPHLMRRLCVATGIVGSSLLIVGWLARAAARGRSGTNRVD